MQEDRTMWRRSWGEAGGVSAEFGEEEMQARMGVDRRTFLKLMGASAALAGLGGCWRPQPVEKIVPYVVQPERVVAGRALYYASAVTVGGWGRGVVVEQHEGRPTKVEGNGRHPSSLGGTDIFMQASVLQLYDPDRAKAVRKNGVLSSFGAFSRDLGLFFQHKSPGGPRVRVLTGTVTSPTVVRQLRQIGEIFPNFGWHRFEGVGSENRQAGILGAFGRGDLTAVYDFTKARRIVSLDAHFLAEEPGSVRYAREFAHGRRQTFKRFGALETLSVADFKGERLTEEGMARLYMAESTVTFTGAMADHRLGVKAGMVAAIAGALARKVAGMSDAGDGLTEEARAWVAAAAGGLREAGAAGLVVVGENQPGHVHALGHAMNVMLGSVGTTVRYVERVDGAPGGDSSLKELVRAMGAGEVDLLLILDVNAVYSAPADLRFGEVLRKFGGEGDAEALGHTGGTPVPRERGMAVYLGMHEDETAELCGWHVPLSHCLEAWGDCRGHEGTASVIQPLIYPLWESRSVVELLAGVRGVAEDAMGKGGATNRLSDGYELVREYWFGSWGEKMSAAEKEGRWRKGLLDGVMEGTAAAGVKVALARDVAGMLGEERLWAAPGSEALELNFRADPSIGDGEWANHPWLQELPKPLTRLTWDNALIVGPATARKLGLGSAEHETREYVPVAKVWVGERSAELAVWVQPGQPEGAMTVYLGGGRRRGGEVLKGAGVDVYPLRTSGAMWFGVARVEKTGRTYELACTQNHQVMEGRDVVREIRVSELGKAEEGKIGSPDLYSTGREKDKDDDDKDDDNDLKKKREVHLSLYEEYRYEGYKWGMVVDLSACVGCNACVVACQAENNIPVVGKEQVLKGREMHWLRIDAYYGGKETRSMEELGENPRMLFQPMMCQHCEDAPCELVCPVEATSHSEEGLNEMTYNRCVGTRYCSNNCPYKVRRFNFLEYNVMRDAVEKMQKNPNVTVRSRGVMEKCTYCVQRINRARIDGKVEWSRNDAAGRGTEMREVKGDGWVNPKALPRLEVVTACQQACPAEAIIFGDMNDERNLVAVLKKQRPWGGIEYGVLTELNTQPRTSYLERIWNPDGRREGGGA